MSINFPSSPVNGQVYSYSGVSWQWNTIYWGVYSAQSAFISSLVTVGTGSPVVYDVSGGTGFFYSINGINGINVFTSGQTLYISRSDDVLTNYLTTGITSSQTITWDKNYWGISATTNVDLILPNTVSKDGYFITIKDESGNCGNYRIRLTPSVGLIDGNNYVDMNINFMSLTCMVRGGNWYLI